MTYNHTVLRFFMYCLQHNAARITVQTTTDTTTGVAMSHRLTFYPHDHPALQGDNETTSKRISFNETDSHILSQALNEIRLRYPRVLELNDTHVMTDIHNCQVITEYYDIKHHEIPPAMDDAYEQVLNSAPVPYHAVFRSATDNACGITENAEA